MTRFHYHPAILERFPSVVGGVLHATGVANGPSSEALVAVFRAEQDAVLARLGDGPLSEVPSLAAWRRASARSAWTPPAIDPPPRRSFDGSRNRATSPPSARSWTSAIS